MALSALQVDISPPELNNRLLRDGGFTASGLVVWKKVRSADGRLGIRVGGNDHRTIHRSLTAGRPVIAKILLDDYANHWVLIAGISGGRYLVRDPLGDGTKAVPLDGLSRGIHGVRIIVE